MGGFAVVVVVLVVVLIGVDAATILREDAANRAAVDAANTKLVDELLVLDPSLGCLVVPAAAAAARNGCGIAVDKARRQEEVGEEHEEGCVRRGPRTLAKQEEPEDEEAVVEVVMVRLLWIARQEDDKSAERVAVHAAQDAMVSKIGILLLLIFDVVMGLFDLI